MGQFDGLLITKVDIADVGNVVNPLVVSYITAHWKVVLPYSKHSISSLIFSFLFGVALLIEC
jgi:hypothetical protein